MKKIIKKKEKEDNKEFNLSVYRNVKIIIWAGIRDRKKYATLDTKIGLVSATWQSR